MSIYRPRRSAIILLLLVGTLASAAPSAAAPTRGSNDFVFPDMCSFPVHVHVEGQFVVGPGGYHENTTYTLTNPATGRSLSQKSVRSDRFDPHPDGGWTSSTTGVVRVTVPGRGLIYADIGRVSYNWDSSGHLISIEVAGRHDPPLAYPAAVCGYLAAD